MTDLGNSHIALNTAAALLVMPFQSLSKATNNQSCTPKDTHTSPSTISTPPPCPAAGSMPAALTPSRTSARTGMPCGRGVGRKTCALWKAVAAVHVLPSRTSAHTGMPLRREHVAGRATVFADGACSAVGHCLV